MTAQDVKKAAQRAYDLMAEIARDKAGNPLTLEGTIRSVILKSPEQIQYRDDALGIMYCVLGSGIGWQNGRLGDRTPNNYINMPPRVGGQGCWSLRFGQDESLATMIGTSEDSRELLAKLKRSASRRHERRMGVAIQTIREIDQRCQQYNPCEVSWYTISWGGCHLCAPRDAQEDFYDGAIETATLILNAQPTLGTERWIVHQRTKQYAKEILETLEAIRHG